MGVWYQRYWEPDKVLWMEGLFRQRLQHLFERHDRDYARDESVGRVLFQRLPEAKPRHAENLDGYVYTALRLSAHDVMSHLYGRPRPPAEVRRGGPLAIAIFERFVLQGRGVRDIAAELDVDEGTVTRWTDWLLRNTRCHWRPRFVDDRAGAGVDGLWGALRPAADSDDPVADECGDRLRERRLERLRAARTALSPLDRRMLTLLCVEGHDPCTAAALLGLSEADLEARHAALMGELERICDAPVSEDHE